MIEENRKEFEKCNIIEYHNAGITGRGITVVVLDDNKKPLPFMDYCEYPLGWFEKTKQHHSTKVIRVIHEVVPDAKIISLPYINEATTQMKNDSIQWILDHKDEIDIINCSFHELANGLITKLEKLNIPIVCASGNDGHDDKISYPAKYLWTIAVGALEEYRDKNAPYSNAGEELDCLGYTNIKIPCTKGIMDFGGTSCATPFVAGMLALLMCAKDKNFTGQEAKEIIKNNCIDYYEKGKDWKSGWGLFCLPRLEVLNDMGVNKPEKIIIHHSLTKDNVLLSDFDAIKRYHMQTNGWSDIGYHWILEKINNKWVWNEGRKENVSGAHCKEQNMNFKSIGICVVGNFDVEIPTPEIYQLVADKCKDIMKRWTINAIETHNKYATYKSCPGNNFKIEEVIKRVYKEENNNMGYKGYKIVDELPIILDGKEIKLKAPKIETSEGGVTMLPLRDFLQDIVRDKFGVDLEVGYDGRVLLNSKKKQ